MEAQKESMEADKRPSSECAARPKTFQELKKMCLDILLETYHKKRCDETK